MHATRHAVLLESVEDGVQSSNMVYSSFSDVAVVNFRSGGGDFREGSDQNEEELNLLMGNRI